MNKLRWFFLLLFTTALVITTPGRAPRAADADSRERPNIIFIMADDLDTEYPDGSWIDHYPRLRELLAEQGTTFRNSFVSISLCCPSRSTFLRGQYGHNTQIFTNQAPGGGFQKFHDLGQENSTIATWLQDAGYKTILLGKYLNGYPGNLGREYFPPGWDEWYSGQRNQYQQFNYDLNENGTIVSYGDAPEDYLQDVIRHKATDFIRRVSESNNKQPFFMHMTPYSPHTPATYAPRHEDEFPDVRAPRPPTFNQPDVSRMPWWVQNRPLLTRRQIRELDALYRKRLQSMLAVAETIEDIIETLRQTGQLDNTYIFFSSDNGFHLGQHRLPQGKNTEFEEDLHVPLLVRGPGVPAGRVLEHLVVNIDLAPTFAELGGARIPEFVDGRSLVPLLRRNPPPLRRWRRAFLMEHEFLQAGAEEPRLAGGAETSADLEPPDALDPTGGPAGGQMMPPPFRGLHTRNLVYVEYATVDQREMYDLDEDPYQESDIVEEADPRLVRRLSAWLERLSNCAGAECRAAENSPPR